MSNFHKEKIFITIYIITYILPFIFDIPISPWGFIYTFIFMVEFIIGTIYLLKYYKY